MTDNKEPKKFVLCAENKDCEDLEKPKIYQFLPDSKAEIEGYLRVIDDSGEDYLYPQANFIMIDPELIKKGSKVFREREKRDAMYKIATFFVEHFWGNPSQMADGLGVLLLTWNNAFYRYGEFDYFALENALRKHMGILSAFRNRDIFSFSDNDKTDVINLFQDFLDALKISEGKKRGVRSPVAVAKALHLLAPAFFPLWDDKIAAESKCSYSKDPISKYIVFMQICKPMAEVLKGKILTEGITLLKVIDEYNYARFTKHWI